MPSALAARGGPIAGALLLALGMPGAALGANTATVTISASVTAKCTFTQAAGQSLVFTNTTGGIDPTLGTSATASTTITYKCTAGQAPSFTFTSPNDSGGNHRVLNGANAIVYTVGFTSGGAGAGFGTGTDKTLTLNGTITSAQYGAAPAGTYTDTLTVDMLP